MISKQYFETTFSLETARALQTWADNNIIVQGVGDYAMEVSYAENGGSVMFAETEMTGMTMGEDYSVRIYMEDIYSNAFRIFINDVPNDNTNPILQLGWVSTPGWVDGNFTATAETMYLAIGDDVPNVGVYSISDNITVKDTAGTNFVTNGTFEGNDTTGWYGQDVNTVISVHSYVAQPPVDNDYLEPVNIPPYDENNPAHGLITTSNGRFTNGFINTASIQHFYIEPGNYSGMGSLAITQSGTASQRKSLSLHNGNDTHPGKLSSAQCAIYDIYLNTASYWDVDRYFTNTVGGSDTQGGYNIRLGNGAKFNTFNRGYLVAFGSVIVFNQCHNNTFQSSRYADQSDPGYDGSVAIQIAPWGATYGQIHNTKVINCEFYNCNDGFQIVRAPAGSGPEYQDHNAEGTIVDSCKFYKDIPYMENAFDIKAGSDSATNPVIISNNIMWGYFEHPDYVPGGYLPGFQAIVVHLEPHNVHIINNVFYDNETALGVGAADPVYGFTYGMVDGKINGNIFYKCGEVGDTDRYPMKVSSVVDTNMDGNYIIDTVSDYDSYLYNNIGTSTMSDTKVSNPLGGTIDWKLNATYPNSATFTTSLTSSALTDNSAFTDFVFIWNEFTNSPETITWAKILDPNGSIVSPV